jgi:alpha-L-rhamnosidase
MHTRIFPISLALVCFTFSLHAQEAAMRAVELTCEYRVDPIGLDIATPRMSWKVDAAQRGAAQTAYQLRVASAPELLEEDQADLWDSGKVESGESLHIVYAGKALSSRQPCYWSVRLWDEAGNAGEWSETAYYEIGYLDPADWSAKYIGLDPANGDPKHPWLRKTLSLDEAPKNARAYVNPLGYYELYINGEKIDDHVLSPAVSQFDKRSFYLVHDITPYLRKGENCIALWLGSGWYAEGLPGVVHPGALVRAQFEMNGNTVVTDDTWKAAPSNIERIDKWHSGHFGGETIDARGEQPEWNLTSFDDSKWSNAQAVDVPAHTVSFQPVEPNRITRAFEPVSVRYYGEKSWLVDFGSNLSGWFEIGFTGLEPGQRLVFEYADRMTTEGLDTFSQRDEYIASGEAGERFRNRFNYHAFRYVRVFGMDEAPDPQTMSAYLIRTDFPDHASFSCSNPLLTRIHDMIHYTFQCLSLGGYLVDCPHIERLGYGGDGQASTDTVLTMYGMGALYKGWMMHWRDVQREGGSLPHTAPNPWSAGGGPYWCGFVIAAPWHLYKQYGDVRVLEENYATMQAWLDGYVKEHTKDGLLQQWPNTDYRNWYLGDWALPDRREKEMEKSTHLTNNCYIVMCNDRMAEIASVLGKSEDAQRYQAQADAMRPIVHAAFYEEQGKTYADDIQLDLALPLMTGVTPEALQANIAKRLEDNILIEREGHLNVGLAGIPLLTRHLTDAGRSDLLFTMLNTDDYPGYGYMLREGATATWEHWDGQRSHIHNCYNGIGMWFYQGLAGIRQDAPGYKHFILKPEIVGDITWATARQETMRGAIISEWRKQENKLTWRIVIPANTSATVYVPAADVDSITEGGSPAKDAAGLQFVETKDGRAIFEAQAGTYVFTVDG